MRVLAEDLQVDRLVQRREVFQLVVLLVLVLQLVVVVHRQTGFLLEDDFEVFVCLLRLARVEQFQRELVAERRVVDL